MQSRPHRPGPAPTTAGRASESRTAAAPSPRHHWKATPMTVTSTTASGNPHVANAAALASATTTLREFLAFKLGDEEYGIDILRVQEIRSYESPTRIANAPSFIKGVVNLRGVIVPIVDIEKLMTSSDMGLLSTAPH